MDRKTYLIHPFLLKLEALQLHLGSAYFINTDTISDKGQFLIVTGEIQYILCYI